MSQDFGVCIQCGHPIESLVRGCPVCAVPETQRAGTEQREAEQEIRAALKRVRGMIIVGIVFLGWIVEVLAYQRAHEVMVLYLEKGLDDPDLEKEIKRVRFAAGVMAFLYYGTTVAYLAAMYWFFRE